VLAVFRSADLGSSEPAAAGSEHSDGWVRNCRERLTAYVGGYEITLPAGALEVADSCSGVRYLMVVMALAVFYGLSWIGDWASRLKLLVVAMLLAMLSN
jgi:hypothetical protein